MQALPLTKRSVLRLSAKIFDPLELLNLFVISIKMLFQMLCKSKLEWDDKLEGPLLKKWVRLAEDLAALLNTKVPRCYYTSHITTVARIQQHIKGGICRSCLFEVSLQLWERKYSTCVIKN